MTTQLSPEPAIRVRGLVKSFKELEVLRGVEFDVEQGSRVRRSWNRCLANAEASRPRCSCRLPARPVASLGSRTLASGREIGARPWPIHSASWANSWSMALARWSVRAVTSEVSTDSIRTGRRMLGGVTVGHIHQLKGIQRRERHPGRRP